MGTRRVKVLDTAAFLNSTTFFFENAITVQEVVDEVRSRAAVVSAMLESGQVHVEKPSARAIDTVKSVATRMGERGKLSKTDILVLALAYDRKGVLVTDDFHVQNVAREMGIPYEAVTESIRKNIRWVRRCSRCGKTFPESYKGKYCPYCGGKIIYSPK